MVGSVHFFIFGAIIDLSPTQHKRIKPQHDGITTTESRQHNRIKLQQNRITTTQRNQATTQWNQTTESVLKI